MIPVLVVEISYVDSVTETVSVTTTNLFHVDELLKLNRESIYSSSRVRGYIFLKYSIFSNRRILLYI